MVGAYTSVLNETKPLIEVSYDGGSNWLFPTSVTTELPKDFDSGRFNDASSTLTKLTRKNLFIGLKNP